MNLIYPEESSSYHSKFKSIVQKIADTITKEIEVLRCKTREKEAIKMYSGGVIGQIAAIHLRNQIERLNESIIVLEREKERLLILSNVGEFNTLDEWIHQTQTLQKSINIWAFSLEGNDYSKGFRKSMGRLSEHLSLLLNDNPKIKLKR